MISTYLTLAVAGFTSTAAASNAYQGMIPEVGIAIATAVPDVEGRSLDRRQNADEAACAASVLENLVPVPTDDAFTSWILEEGGDPLQGEGCTVTVPSSLSDEYMDYYSTLTDWIATLEDDAASATDCGLSEFGLTFTPLCTSSRTIYWSAANATGTADLPSTVLPTVDLPTETIFIGAAPKTGRFLGAAATGFAVFVSAVLLM